MSPHAPGAQVDAQDKEEDAVWSSIQQTFTQLPLGGFL